MAEHPLESIIASMKNLGQHELIPTWIIIDDVSCFENAMPSADEMHAFVRSLQPVDGWVWRLRQNGDETGAREPTRFSRPGGFDQVAASGIILDGEFTLDEFTSCRLQHVGGQSWRMQTVQEVGSDEEGSIPVLAHGVRQMTADSKTFGDKISRDRFLTYRRFYSVDDEGLAQIIAARFTGYEWQPRDG